MFTNPHNKPIKVKFIDANRHEDDNSPWPISSSVAFMTKAGDGINVEIKERLSLIPGDTLYINLNDTYGKDTSDSTESELRKSPTQ